MDRHETFQYEEPPEVDGRKLKRVLAARERALQEFRRLKAEFHAQANRASARPRDERNDP